MPATVNPSHVENNALKRWTRGSAVVRYMFYNLKVEQLIRKPSWRLYAANVDLVQIEQRRPDIAKAVAYILRQIRMENPAGV